MEEKRKALIITELVRKQPTPLNEQVMILRVKHSSSTLLNNVKLMLLNCSLIEAMDSKRDVICWVRAFMI